MLRPSWAAITAALIGLAGCAPEPGRIPSELVGVWATDCARPFVRFEPDKAHFYADKATYPVRATSLGDGQIAVEYRTPSGGVRETYQRSGQSLRLLEGRYGASAGKRGLFVTWGKPPMERCEAA